MAKAGIDYGFSWNPWSGCDNPASECAAHDHCWARRQARRRFGVYGTVPKGSEFAPRFYPDRLAEPYGWRKPRRVLVGFMGDPFCPGAKPDWIRRVIGVAEDNLRHSFIFLTKRPEGYEGLTFPGNCWVGTSFTGAEPSDSRLARLPFTPMPAPNVWASYEPILGPYPETWVGGFVRWLVLGAEGGPGARPPQESWVRRVIEVNQSRLPHDKAALFIKDNLAPFCREWGVPVVQEYPEGMVGAR